MKASALKDEQFVVDAQGKRLGVLLDLETYKRLREAEEDLSDIRAYDAAASKARSEVRSGRFSSLASYRARRLSKRK